MLARLVLASCVCIMFGLAASQAKAQTFIEGSWYDKSRSGSGFVLQEQWGKVAGYYFGYDVTGVPVWYLFSGDLDYRRDEPEVLATVSAPLLKFSDGACDDCDYKAPIGEAIGEEISIVFSGIGEAEYRIGDGELRTIRPIAYGMPSLRDDDGFELPGFGGVWVGLSFDGSGVIEGKPRSYQLHLGHDPEEGTAVGFGFVTVGYEVVPEFEIHCDLDSEPVCELWPRGGETEPLAIRRQDIGPEQFIARGNGVTVKFRKF